MNTYEKVSGILKVLGHPVRLRIVHGLMSNECCVSQMVEKLELPQSTVSQHLAALRNKEIIQPRKTGVLTCYYVANQKVRDIITVLIKE